MMVVFAFVLLFFFSLSLSHARAFFFTYGGGPFQGRKKYIKKRLSIFRVSNQNEHKKTKKKVGSFYAQNF